MKRLLTATTMALFLLFLIPALCFSAYLIHLKDGGQFTTDRYWEEGDQIKFKRFGGQVGIPKDLVREIEEVRDKLENSPSKPADNMNAGTDEAGNCEEGKRAPSVEVSEEEKKKAVEEKADRMQALLDEKRQIMREKEAVIRAYKEAKANKNMEKKKQYWNKLLSLGKKLENLRERAVAENGGRLPDWWDDVR